MLVGVAYAFVGIVFAFPTSHVQLWRLAAWVASAMAFAAYIACERFRLESAPRAAAVHVALAVALGAFGLAVGANVHSLSVASSSQQRRLLLIALGAWPLLTALPAFVVALGAGWLLARVPSRHGSSTPIR